MQYLRKWALTDVPDLTEAINNKKIQNNLRDGIPYPYTEKDAEGFVTAMLEAPTDTTFAWAIAVDGKAVGSIGIFRKENIHNRTAEIGYYLAEPYWGRGIVTAAVREACAEVFAHTDIVRIFAEPFASNEGSCRVLEKAGFMLEGVLKQNAFKNGEILDMKMYALIR